MSAAQVKALRALAAPIVSSFDADLEDVTVRPAGKRRIVRVVVGHDDGVSLDLVADISRALSVVLDDSDVLGQSPYVLEVTSPGVDRPLTLPRHWRRAVGRLVEVLPADGEAWTGRVLAATESGATLDTGSDTVEVAYVDVRRAVVQVEFSRVADADLAEDEDVADDPDPADDEDQEA